MAVMNTIAKQFPGLVLFIGSSTLVREQESVVCAFKSTNINTIKTLYDYWGSDMYDKLADFRERYSKSTNEKHTCLLYIADDQRQDENKNMYSFQAPDYRLFRLRF